MTSLGLAHATFLVAADVTSLEVHRSSLEVVGRFSEPVAREIFVEVRMTSSEVAHKISVEVESATFSAVDVIFSAARRMTS